MIRKKGTYMSGFMSYTAASHRGAIKVFRFHLWGWGSHVGHL